MPTEMTNENDRRWWAVWSGLFSDGQRSTALAVKTTTHQYRIVPADLPCHAPAGSCVCHPAIREVDELASTQVLLQPARLGYYRALRLGSTKG